MKRRRKHKKITSADAERVLSKALQHVESYLDCLGTAQIAPLTQKDAEVASQLGQRAASIVGELRKVEAAARRQLQDLSRPRITAWARSVTAEERRSIAQEIIAMDSKGSILA